MGRARHRTTLPRAGDRRSPYIGPVQTHEPDPPCTLRLDRERGRLDDRAQLQLHLSEAPADYLEGALDNTDLGPDELAQLLRNRSATTDIVVRIGRNRAWMRSRALRVAFVANPRAPYVLARQQLPHLFWRDLAGLATNLRVSPMLRREAEKLIGTRLPELSTGERVALARQGSRGLVEILREETESSVLRALAGNPRAKESDLVRILARRDVPGDFLGWLADQSPWGARRAVRLGLVRHSRTPSAAALRLTHGLTRRDLDDLRHDAAAPRLVRVAAERQLASDGHVSSGIRPHFG